MRNCPTKIWMWPFVETRIARRSSPNRPAGIPETKVIDSNEGTYRRFMIEKIAPVIKLWWPNQGLNRTVVIQHDGASCYIKGYDFKFDQAAKHGVWNICVEKQPAKSPGTNVLDLSFSELCRQNSEVWDLRQQLMV